MRAQSVEARRLTGYLPGELKPPAHMTAIGFLTHLGRLRGGVERRAIDELAARLELDLERRIGDLSKGNKQKVGLVAAFMHDPELLILDEPTSGLDPIRQEDVLDLVRERAAAGRTVFLSSHELDQVEHVAERVGIVREGRLVAVDSIAALKERAIRRVEVRLAAPAEGVERLRDGARRRVARARRRRGQARGARLDGRARQSAGGVPGADADERAARARRDLPLLLRALPCELRSPSRPCASGGGRCSGGRSA